MKHPAKKLMSILLSLCMLLSLLPAMSIPAAATGTPTRTVALDFTDSAETPAWQTGCTQDAATTTLWTNTAEGWSYDTKANKLTLSGATIDCSGVTDSLFAVKLPDGAVIWLTDGTTSTVKAGPYAGSTDEFIASAFAAATDEGSLTVLGNGTLNVTSGNVTGTDRGHGITTTFNVVTIGAADSAPIVTAQAGTALDAAGDTDSTVMSSYGVNIVTMVNGTLEAIGNTAESNNSERNSYGISSLNLNGGSVTAIGGEINGESQRNSVGVGGIFEVTAGSAYMTGQDRALVGSMVDLSIKGGMTYNQAESELTAGYFKSEELDGNTMYTPRIAAGGTESVPLTAYVSVAPVVAVSAQDGNLPVGKVGSATFAVTAAHFKTAPAAADYSLEWFGNAEGTGTGSAAVPSGLTVDKTSATQLTINTTAASVAGTYYFKLTAVSGAESATSGVVTVTVETLKVAEVTIGATTTKYTDFATAWSYAAMNGTSTSPATFKLLADWTAVNNSFGTGSTGASAFGDGNYNPSGAICVPSGKTVILDLNGKTIDRAMSDPAGNSLGAVITVNGNLTMNDTSSAGSGKITGGYGQWVGGVYVTSGATFTMNGGTITGNKAYATDNSYAGGVAVVSSTSTASIFTMNGGSITGNTGACGVYIYSSKMRVSGKVVIANNLNGTRNVNAYIYGPIGIVGPLTDGASIGVTTYEKPTSAGQIAVTEGNTADYSACFHSDDSTYSIYNDATTPNAQVVKLKVAPTVTIGLSPLSVGGSKAYTVTTTNFAAAPTYSVKWYSDDTCATEITPTGISVTSSATNATSGTLTVSAASTTTAGNYYFKLTAANGSDTVTSTVQTLTVAGPAATVTIGSVTTGYATCADAWNYAAANGTDAKPATVTLNTDWTAANHSFGTGVGFGDGNNTTGSGNLLVPNGKNIILDLNGHKIDGGATAASTSGVYDIKSAGTFKVKDSAIGGQITGGYGSSNDAAGISVASGTTTIEGGSITGNYGDTGSPASGVLVDAQADLIMTGGSITGNKNCAGVYFYSGTFSVSGSPVISDNYFSDDTECNVYLCSGYSVKVTGALGDGASIGVTTEIKPTSSPVTIADAATGYTISDSDSSKFHSDANYSVGLKNSAVQLNQGASIIFDGRSKEPISIPVSVYKSLAVADSEIRAELAADFAWNDYTLAGWYTGIDGTGTEIADLTALKNSTADTTVYAKWTKGGRTVRTTSLNFTAKGLTYTKADGTTATVDPRNTSVTNSAEGWSWNATTNTLTLSGLYLDTIDRNAITIPDGAIVTLAAGTTSTVKSSFNGTEPSTAALFSDEAVGGTGITIGGSGTLNAYAGVSTQYDSVAICGTSGVTIEGTPTINACGGGDTTTPDGTNSVGISSPEGNVLIKGGTVTATGGVSDTDSNNKASAGINAGGTLTIQGGTVTAAGGNTAGRANSVGLLSARGTTISGGTVKATAGTSLKMSVGIASYGNISFTGGGTTAYGKGAAMAAEGTINLTDVSVVVPEDATLMKPAGFEFTLILKNDELVDYAVVTKSGNYRLECMLDTGIGGVPAALADEYPTEDAIKSRLRVSIDYELDSENNKVGVDYFDIELMVSTDGGITWSPATAANFPAGGVDVVIPWKQLGTTYEIAKNTEFSVSHMFETNINGHTPGEVEMPECIVTREGLMFKVTGMSPVAVGFKLLPMDSAKTNGGRVISESGKTVKGDARSSVTESDIIVAQAVKTEMAGESNPNTGLGSVQAVPAVLVALGLFTVLGLAAADRRKGA